MIPPSLRGRGHGGGGTGEGGGTGGGAPRRGGGGGARQPRAPGGIAHVEAFSLMRDLYAVVAMWVSGLGSKGTQGGKVLRRLK